MSKQWEGAIRGIPLRRATDRDLRGRWVESGLYCTVSYRERTDSGALRAPVFIGMVESE